MNNGFNIDKAEIDNIFKIYQQRKTNEEIDYINSAHKGLQGLAKKLRTDLNSGISTNTLELRRQAFDDNLRYREPMPSFWYFVKDAFGDEILQILCVCSIIEIILKMINFQNHIYMMKNLYLIIIKMTPKKIHFLLLIRILVLII